MNALSPPAAPEPQDVFPAYAAARALRGWRAAGTGAEARLRMRDGVNLAVRFVFPKTPGALDPETPMAVILHGAGMHSGYYLPMARMLAGKGLAAALIDQRGHGESEGRRGHIDHPEDYVRDVDEALKLLAETGLPLAVLAHSGAAAMALKALALRPHPAARGFALMTPTFADDGMMVRRSTGGRDFASALRYMIRPEPETAPAAPKSGAAPQGGDRMGFRLGRFVAYRMTRLGAGGAVLTYTPSRAGEPSYVYSARGVHGSMVGAAGPLLQVLRLPVLLATGGQDRFVNSDSVRLTIPWFIEASTPFAAVHEPRGDHFTTLLLTAGKIADWALALPARRAATARPQAAARPLADLLADLAVYGFAFDAAPRREEAAEILRESALTEGETGFARHSAVLRNFVVRAGMLVVHPYLVGLLTSASGSACHLRPMAEPEAFLAHLRSDLRPAVAARIPALREARRREIGAEGTAAAVDRAVLGRLLRPRLEREFSDWLGRPVDLAAPIAEAPDFSTPETRVVDPLSRNLAALALRRAWFGRSASGHTRLFQVTPHGFGRALARRARMREADFAAALASVQTTLLTLNKAMTR